MRAIVSDKFGGLESLVYTELPEPERKLGHVVIAINAFGINHAEMHMRRGEWAEPARVSGIEHDDICRQAPLERHSPLVRPMTRARERRLSGSNFGSSFSRASRSRSLAFSERYARSISISPASRLALRSAL